MISHMDGYNKDCFDSNYEKALDVGKTMAFLLLHLQAFLIPRSLMDFHFLHEEKFQCHVIWSLNQMYKM